MLTKTDFDKTLVNQCWAMSRYTFDGSKALAWKLLINHIILTEYFVNDFLSTLQQKDCEGKVLKSIYEHLYNIFHEGWFVNGLEQDFFEILKETGNLLFAALGWIETYSKSGEVRALEALKELGASPFAYLTLGKDDFLWVQIDKTHATKQELAQARFASVLICNGLEKQDLLPFNNNIFNYGGIPLGFYEIIAHFRISVFVLGSRIMEKYLKPWVEGEYSPLPFGKIEQEYFSHGKANLETFLDATQWGEFAIKRILAASASYQPSSQKPWLVLLQLDTTLARESQPVFLPLLPQILKELAGQVQFLEALLGYSQAGQPLAQFKKLKEKCPKSFCYRQSLKLLEQYMPTTGHLWSLEDDKWV